MVVDAKAEGTVTVHGVRLLPDTMAPPTAGVPCGTTLVTVSTSVVAVGKQEGLQPAGSKGCYARYFTRVIFRVWISRASDSMR